MISLNIEGVKSNQEYLLELLKAHQPSVTCLQETWLLSYQQPFRYLPETYEYQIKCLDDDEPVKQTHHSRGSAGTANIWPSNQCTPLIDGNHRICRAQHGETGIIILNVYLPPRGRYANDDFRAEIDRLHEICEKYDDQPILLLGDVNIDLNKKIDSRAKYLQNFLKQHGFREPIHITEPTFTQHSGKGSSKIDYVFLNLHLMTLVDRVEYRILDDHHLNTSSHQALIAKLFLKQNLKRETPTQQKPHPGRLAWDKCDDSLYCDTLESALDTGAHHEDTDLAVEYLIQSLHHAAKVAVPVSRPKPKKAPWSPIIANARSQSKMAHTKWSEAGRPDYNHPLSASRQAAKKLLR